MTITNGMDVVLKIVLIVTTIKINITLVTFLPSSLLGDYCYNVEKQTLQN